MTEEEFEEYQRRLEEYVARLVPATDEEIIQVAETLWAAPALRAIFERVGYDGDMTDEEEAAVDAAVAACRVGALWDRDELHLALAPPLVRQFAAGMIEGLDSQEARSFLKDRKVKRAGALVKTHQASAEEIMNLARAMRADPDVWSMIEQLKDVPDLFVFEVDKEGVIGLFERSYRFKYGLFNRSGYSPVGVLRAIAAGNIDSLDSPEAREIIEKTSRQR